MKKVIFLLMVTAIAAPALAVTQDDVVLYRAGSWMSLYTAADPTFIDATNPGSNLGWGAPTDVPLLGDVTGDGIDDVILARNNPAGTSWYAGHSVDSGGGVGVLSNAATSSFGPWGSTANIQGQFATNVNGDAYDDVITVVAPAGGGGITFFAAHSNNGLSNATGSSLGIGNTTLGDVPFMGDFNGDGYTDACIYRNGAWYPSASGAGGLATGTAFTGGGGFGTAGDVPLAGDMNGDGRDDYILFRNGSWFCREANLDGSMSGTAIPLTAIGTTGDIPLIADIDGDGIDDNGIFRDGFWAFRLSNNGGVVGTDTMNWGTVGDIPLIGQFNVPEPATMIMLGLGGLTLLRKKR